MISDNFEFGHVGPPDSGFSLFLAERTKKVHFIRHAEGYHNVKTAETGSNACLLRGDIPADEHPLWDAKLTPKGIRQAKELRAYLARRPSGGRPYTAFELVIVSPLTRTLQTALHAFGRPRKPGLPAFLDEGVEYDMEDDSLKGIRVPAPRIIVREECRERWGHYVCDGRRSIREIIKEFPDFDFSEIAYDDDVFYTDQRESDEACCERTVQFLEWLNKRPEKCIAVVTHSSFLRHLFGQFGAYLADDDKDSLQRLASNCELRSVVMASHGNKDGKVLRPLLAPHTPASTVNLDDVKEEDEMRGRAVSAALYNATHNGSNGPMHLHPPPPPPPPPSKQNGMSPIAEDGKKTAKV